MATGCSGRASHVRRGYHHVPLIPIAWTLAVCFGERPTLVASIAGFDPLGSLSEGLTTHDGQLAARMLVPSPRVFGVSSTAKEKVRVWGQPR